MINDRQASELVSKSLRQRLQPDEAAQVEQQLQSNPNLRAFAKISEIIQHSLADIGMMAAAGDEHITPGLSEDARRRLRDSVNREVLRHSQDGLPKANPYDHDIRVAAALMDADLVEEDTIRTAVASWDKRPGSLGEHLVASGIVSTEQYHQAKAQVADGAGAKKNCRYDCRASGRRRHGMEVL